MEDNIEFGVVPQGQVLSVPEFSSTDFKEMYDTDLRPKIKKKNNLDYIPWAVAWAEIKKKDPLATFEIERFEDDAPFQFFPGMGYLVWTSITVKGFKQTMHYPVIDYKNKPIIEGATVFDINTALMRCLAKNAAMFGVALYIYEGIDDQPEVLAEAAKLVEECMSLIKTKSALSDAAKKKVEELCKTADPDANGDPRLISDTEKLKLLKKQLMGVRK